VSITSKIPIDTLIKTLANCNYLNLINKVIVFSKPPFKNTIILMERYFRNDIIKSLNRVKLVKICLYFRPPNEFLFIFETGVVFDLFTFAY
jgi:hypothetical protein